MAIFGCSLGIATNRSRIHFARALFAVYRYNCIFQMWKASDLHRIQSGP
jgi:hypothetical protein